CPASGWGNCTSSSRRRSLSACCSTQACRTLRWSCAMRRSPPGPFGRRALVVKAATPNEFHAAFAAMVRAGVGALLVGSGPVFTSQRARLAVLSARHAIPSSYVDREFVLAGGLMSYGPSQTDAYRRAGIYVGRILKGEKPGDLPIEQPTKFELVINLGT